MAIDITSVLQEFQQREQLVVPDIDWFQPNINSDGPAKKIAEAINAKALKLHYFPFDLPPHHFTIIEGTPSPGGPPTGTGATGFAGFQKAYKLPMPTVIQDTHSIKYDHSFNWLGLIASGTGLGGAAGLATKALAGLGFAVNNFKAVTLSVPEFRTFQLEWRLFPKSITESQAIQKLIISMQTGATPPKGEVAGYPLVLNFPNIFICYFTTGQSAEDGSRYLFKFKPAVLQGIQVNYQGDSPVPAFYKNEEDQAIPEGVSIRTSWLELELWTRQNFINSTAADDLYNNDPLSAFN